ncbi:hypothetical protein V6N13_112298 [Hibiscus sabdariffa]|uniref:Uncharacterized protein n=1 Tax=Hibiscus sabdariffa TaxID=183260 RepID=A0ABR2TMU3_9ROSI
MDNFRCKCLLFLGILLIFSYEALVFAEGRSLKPRAKLEKVDLLFSPDGMTVSARPKMKNVGNIANPFHHVFRSLEGYADAFRPTTPGHSPGVGHSIQH